MVVARVYLDQSAVLQGEAGGWAARGPRAAVPGATEALRNLADLVDEVFVLADGPLPALDLPDTVHLTTGLPAIPGDAWFVTADPGTLHGHPASVRTVLVGPKRAPGPLPLPRHDVAARDLPAAVMEILTRQAMH